MTAPLKLHPAWKQALADLVAKGLADGEVITKDSLTEAFGLTKPITARDQEKFQLEFLSQMSALRQELLARHQFDLRAMRGDAAYQVVPAREQTGLAMSDGMRALKKGLRQMTSRVTHVRTELLTAEERQQNTDAQVKVATLTSMVHRPDSFALVGDKAARYLPGTAAPKMLGRPPANDEPPAEAAA